MNQATSNSSMPKSTAEALKLIQKQGLSISIVSRDNSRSSQQAESPVGAKDMKPKQIVSIDKSTKLPIRSSIVTENKATLSQARSIPNALSETRNSSGQTPNSSHFQENKISGIINKTLVPISTSSETRVQAWNNSPATESKPQMGSNQVTVAENKNLQAGRHVQGQLVYSEGKIQVAKSSPNISEGIKVQSRIGQVGGQPSNVAGRNVQGNQVKSPMSSPPLEKKVLNTDRQPQNFENVLENFKNPQQRLVSEPNQTKFVVSNKVGDVTLPTQLRVSQIMKGTPAERIQSPKVQQLSNVGFQVRVPSVERSPATVDEKTLVKPKRLTQNTVLPKNLASVQIQKSPNTSMHSDFAAIGQVVKIISSPSDSSQRQSFEHLESTPSGKITMSSSRATPKRAPAARALTNSPVAKKKCVKKMSPDKISGMNNLEARTPKGIEMQNRGLTITPIATSTPESSIMSSASQVVKCPHCEKHSYRFDYCQHCDVALPPNLQKFRIHKVKDIPMAQQASRETVKQVSCETVKQVVTTTSTIEKKIIYHFPEGMGPVNQSYQSISMRENVVLETRSPLGTRGGRGRGKSRRKIEPPVLTISSDDEEPPVVMHPMQASSMYSSQVYNPNESEGSKSDHSSTSEMLNNELHDENQEDSDDQFPGVTDINPSIEEDEPEEEMEFEAEEIEEEEENFSEECEEEEEEIPEEHNEGERLAQGGRHPSLRCRSIRIGSYKVHPRPTQPYVAVVLDEGYIAFNAPIISDPSGNQVHITLGSGDVHKMYFHFGRCLPVMFITTTPKFGELVRNALHMIENETPYFDPSTKDDKTQKLTFLIESITEQQKSFLKTKFAGDNKTIEIDQKTANEILVKSTPNQNAVLQLKRPDPVPTVSSDHRLPQISNQISVTKVTIPPKPVVKLLTYPAPPLTGGIAITNEDLNCLNEGEFLNDAIIDFYLKYLFHEKLSPYYQERTHIFSSFFYPRLTHRQDRPRGGDDTAKTMPARRHNQVKTWTRHVDIFSKDYIIIPVNQNVHWFLAVICYPSRVPDAPIEQENKMNDSAALNDSVTSTNEHDHKVTIKEITSNGEDDSQNLEDSMNSGASSPYEVEEPPDSDDCSEAPDSTTNPDGKQRREMPCICIFDSLSGPSRVRIATVLREYLELEWKCKKGTKKVFNKSTMQGFVMKCPQQTNFSDCGVYLLQFVESFFEHPIPFCNPMPDLTDWFTEEKIKRKRQQLKDLILNLREKQEAIAARKSQSSSGNSQHSDNR